MAAKTPRGVKRSSRRAPRKRSSRLIRYGSITGSQAQRLRGRRGLYHAHRRPNTPNVWWPVKILDFKLTGWGRVHLLVRPAGGFGEFWTEADRVTLGKRPPR